MRIMTTKGKTPAAVAAELAAPALALVAEQEAVVRAIIADVRCPRRRGGDRVHAQVRLPDDDREAPAGHTEGVRRGAERRWGRRSSRRCRTRPRTCAPSTRSSCRVTGWTSTSRAWCWGRSSRRSSASAFTSPATRRAIPPPRS